MKTKNFLQSRTTSQATFNRILVPVDFSGSAGEALSYAVSLAKNVNARIVLLHVIEPAYAGAEPGLGYMPQQIDAQQVSARKLMRDIADKFVPKGLLEKMVLRMGCPYLEITDAAKALKAALIVITTHGRTGLSHILMGSTAERVVQHAHCPVLTVRRREDGEAAPPPKKVSQTRPTPTAKVI
jgi:nucleotide-binding universal stress UspA family protein